MYKVSVMEDEKCLEICCTTFCTGYLGRTLEICYEGGSCVVILFTNHLKTREKKRMLLIAKEEAPALSGEINARGTESVEQKRILEGE